MRRAVLGVVMLPLLAACHTTPDQALFVSAKTYTVAEQAANAAITSGAVNRATADRIKACDNVGFGMVQPLVKAEANGTPVTSAIVQSATNGLTTFSACLGSAGVTIPAVGATQ